MRVSRGLSDCLVRYGFRFRFRLWILSAELDASRRCPVLRRHRPETRGFTCDRISGLLYDWVELREFWDCLYHLDLLLRELRLYFIMVCTSKTCGCF